MKLRSVWRIFGCVLCLFWLGSCESKDSPKAATSSQTSQTEVVQAEPELPKVLPPPPGDPGPFLVRMERGFPNHIFGMAATEKQFAIAMQGDARDISLCTKTNLPVCFQGRALIADRTNPNQPVMVDLYESDTQSGSQVDDVAAVGQHFAFAINEGLYVGDTQNASLVLTDGSGHVERNVDLGQSGVRIVKTSLCKYTDAELMMCRGIEPEVKRDQLMPRIICERYLPQNGQRSPVASIQSDQMIRNMDLACNGERALLSWIEAGHAKAAFLDKSNEVMDLGLATAMPPYVAAGFEAFAVAWQGDDGEIRIDRISKDGKDRKTLLLNGIRHRSVNGLVATSYGYLMAFRHQNTPQVALIAPDFSAWHLVDNSQSWRMFSDYASLDIQDAHTGRMVWQTAESLIQPR